MSRIGKLPITVPSGVDVQIDGRTVTVKGPKGTLSHTVIEPITVEREESGVVVVKRPDDERRNKAYHDRVVMPHSKLKVAIAEILQKEGYIAGHVTEDAEVGKSLVIELKYGRNRERDGFDRHLRQRVAAQELDGRDHGDDHNRDEGEALR